MRPKTILILAAVLLIAGLVGYVAITGDQDRLDAQRLSRQAAKTQTDNDNNTSVDFDALAAEGKGQPVPENLEVHPSPDRMYWFVGEESIDSGVEVPFAPGRIPTPPPNLEPLRKNPGFVGAAACRQCHQERHDTFAQTAHHKTSQLANQQTVDGSFQPGQNRMKTGDPKVHFTMIERDDRLYQRVSFHGWQFEVPFDLISGSSKLAQSYLYWHGDQLYQMNVNYLSEPGRWINSPGYIDGDAAYARPVPVRCMECHVTYIELREPPNHYTPSSLILGISCERCHGPGQEHIAYHQANPKQQQAKFVTLPSDLSRQQQLDICGQCHNGSAPLKGDAFQFRPGDKLSDHYFPSPVTGEDVSVHTSNQQARMASSECYQHSEMTCTTCHDPHENERGQMALFSSRCLECHEDQHCGMFENLGARITENCIDCHMPRRSGDFLKVSTAEGMVFPPLRDHYIRVDQQATQAFLQADQTAPQD